MVYRIPFRQYIYTLWGGIFVRNIRCKVLFIIKQIILAHVWSSVSCNEMKSIWKHITVMEPFHSLGVELLSIKRKNYMKHVIQLIGGAYMTFSRTTLMIRIINFNTYRVWRLPLFRNMKLIKQSLVSMYCSSNVELLQNIAYIRYLRLCTVLLVSSCS